MCRPLRLTPASEMQALDRATIETFGLPGETLMETAGRTASRLLDAEFPVKGKRLVILVGPGNNGGDGFVMGRILAGRGGLPHVLLAVSGELLTGDAKTQRDRFLAVCPSGVTEITEKTHLEKASDWISQADILVDALFGVGLVRPVEGRFAGLIRLANQSPAPTVSVDIPSGISADTGGVLGSAIKADATTTFAFAKPGHFLEPGRTHTGHLAIADIGIPKPMEASLPASTLLLTSEWAKSRLPERSAESHKGNFGHVLIVAGNDGTAGAASLCAHGCHRMGPGLVTLLTRTTSPLPGLFPETMVKRLESAADLEAQMNGKRVIAAGPGMGTDKTAAELLSRILATDLPLVLDADALTLLAGSRDLTRQLAKRSVETVLTPHPGEMARLTGNSPEEIQKDRIRTARNLAGALSCHVVLKGATTVISHPDGTAGLNPTGNSGMATGGSGDVLCGILAGLIAQGVTPGIAAGLGTFLHGLAADQIASRTPAGYLPSEVAAMLPSTLALLSSQNGPVFAKEVL